MAIDARIPLMGRHLDLQAAQQGAQRTRLADLGLQQRQRDLDVRQAMGTPEEEAAYIQRQRDRQEQMQLSAWERDTVQWDLQTARYLAASGQDDQLQSFLNTRLNAAQENGWRTTPLYQGGLNAFQQGGSQAVLTAIDQMGGGQGQERKVRNDQFGVPRYEDTGEAVFPDAKAPPMTPEEAQERQDALERERRLASKLPADSVKDLLENSDAARASRNQYVALNGLAEQFDAFSPPAGAVANWQENYKQFAGSEDAISVLRTNYKRLVNNEVINSLPPGVASDKDIELAREGFLSATAEPGQVANFLRGMGKLQIANAAYHQARADWYDTNTDLRGFDSYWRNNGRSLIKARFDTLTPQQDDGESNVINFEDL